MAERSAKRVRLEKPQEEASVSDDSMSAVEEESEARDSSENEGEDSGEETGVTDEEEAIRALNAPQRTKKRRRALSPEAFGARLQDLLDAPAPTTKELSRLHRPAKKAQNEEAIERKALRLVQASKHASRERGHVTDIISGWPARPAVPFKDWPNMPLEELEAPGGAEAEKALRRLAQKGVVKLCNAIRAAQGSAPTAGASTASNASVASKKRKTIMPSKEETPDLADKKTASTQAPNMLGTRGKEVALANLSRDSFLSILKSGGTNKSAVPSVA